jgi:alpha-galactosidase
MFGDNLHHMRWIATETPSATCTAAGFAVDLLGDAAPFTATLAARELAPGLIEVDLVLESPTAAVPSTDLILRWSLPAHDLHCCWRPDKQGSTSVQPDFSRDETTSRVAAHAPVICLHSTGGINRLTAAFDDALHATKLWAGIREENGRAFCTGHPFAAPRPAGTRFSMRLRIDRRPLAWHAAIRAVVAWWETLPGHQPAAVPATGLEPMYSTWYSLHQNCPPDAVEAQCRLAKPLGCDAVIVDDGWQTLDGARGYAFTGDWEPERMGDMRAHVDRVHALGMRYLLWFSVPFIGYRSQAWKKFSSMMLRREDALETGIVDPRFPEVREHLAGIFARCLRAWDLDGLKLDFIDAWWFDPNPVKPGDGRDIVDLDVAVDALMKDILARVRQVKPDVMIEFRQAYVGPLMRTYGNLFRAADCPGDVLINRARTLDLRVLCGKSAVHADMLMWHQDEPVAAAALQFLAVIFAVPQISVDLTRISADHGAMLRFWTSWWRAHRACLLGGDLDPRHPELGFPVVQADGADESVIAVYADAALGRVVGTPPTLHVVNASRQDRVVLDISQDLGTKTITVRNCMGQVVSTEKITLSAGVHALAIPASGVAELAT